jgi:hypothetical protein
LFGVYSTVRMRTLEDYRYEAFLSLPKRPRPNRD